jgi:hypothetical protein
MGPETVFEEQGSAEFESAGRVGQPVVHELDGAEEGPCDG